MRIVKAWRRRLCEGLAAALLLAQIATAAHACPLLAGALGRADPPMAGMPCEHTMAGSESGTDAVSSPVDAVAGASALCIKHCQGETGQQPPDAQPAVGAPLAGAVLLLWPVLMPPALAAIEGPTWLAHHAHRERAPPVPTSIWHCCFRI
jgi:hypothetical protein